MQLAARTGAWTPKYKRRLAWIRNSGNQHIDIPCSGIPGTYFGVKGTICPEKFNVGTCLFDSNVSDQFKADQYSFTPSTNVLMYSSGIGGKYDSGGWSVYVGYANYFELSTAGRTLEEVFSPLARPLTNSISKLRVFKKLSNGKPIADTETRVIELQVISGDNVQFNGYPVMSLDDEPCFYDEVGGELFRNSGTGTFAYGELDASSALDSSRGGGY